MAGSRILLVGLVATLGCEPADTDESASQSRFESLRKRMVQEQLIGPGRNIRDPRVIQAMETVPRHQLVPAPLQADAYADRPLPIGHGQTISQPYIVAFMTEQLGPKPTDRVLEIGTGSGYQAAVLSGLVSEVYTIEIVEQLAERAATNLKRLGYANVNVRSGDGHLGWSEKAPFDCIIVTCAPEDVPQPLVDQLKEGGRLIIPVGPVAGIQELYLLEKRQGQIKKKAVLSVRFVPMTGESAP
jgi:protein-L-isoaspartate(D-aspartate) O-methyltransferase